MTDSGRIPYSDQQPLLTEADDHFLASVVDQAELPPLLTALAQATGDPALLDPKFRPRPRPTASGVDPQGGLSEEVQAQARRAAVNALRTLRDRSHPWRTDVDSKRLLELMRFIAQGIGPEYLDLARQELGLPDDAGRPDWHKRDIAPGVDIRVVVIGAGMSGLVAAHRLRQAGVAVTVLEKNKDVGGVWLENTYPGCRLDTPNFAYSYAFAQRSDWSHQFSLREEIYDYFVSVAEQLGVRDDIRFDSEVTRLDYDSTACGWNVQVRGSTGSTEYLWADIVVSAVGQLNRPKYPEIAGIDTFQKNSFHSGHWDHDVELEGLRVAVVGTGASAYQIIPAIADSVAELTVFQRTPPWMMPTPSYHDPIPDGMRWLFDVVPYYGRWFRFWQFWQSVEGRRIFVEVDPDWDHPVSVSEANEEFRLALVEHLRRQFADTPDLMEQVIPDYPPGAKRLLRDNGDWARTLKQSNVHLIGENIAEITPTGIATGDGHEFEFDLIIYATGFRASDFLVPMDVVGKDGRNLHDDWGGDAKAYLGLSVPGFPNLFCLYGPNTNLVVNGSLILFSEAGVHYVLEAVRILLEQGGGALDVRQDVTDEYNKLVDEANSCMAWGASDVRSWYKNASGRVSQNWPFSILEYWERTRTLALNDYRLDGPPSRGQQEEG